MSANKSVIAEGKKLSLQPGRRPALSATRLSAGSTPNIRNLRAFTRPDHDFHARRRPGRALSIVPFMPAIASRRITTPSSVKLIVHGRTRRECLMRLRRRALSEMVVGGVHTTLDLHRRLVENEDVQNGNYNIHWLEKFLADNKIVEEDAVLTKKA